MAFAELLKKNREIAGISHQELAKRLSIPLEILLFLENPVDNEGKICSLFAKTLGLTDAVFRGEKPPKPAAPTEEEKRAAAVKGAKFPCIRKFILDPTRCENPENALKLFDNQPLSLAEKNVILYLSTTALYHFCDTNTSSFSFDSYLFKLHAVLLERYEKELNASNLDPEVKEERLGIARSNIFSCDTIANIAIRVVEPFAEEMEKKLAQARYDFDDDLGMPFRWCVNGTLSKIEILSVNGMVKDEIRLLDVKERSRVDKG